MSNKQLHGRTARGIVARKIAEREKRNAKRLRGADAALKAWSSTDIRGLEAKCYEAADALEVAHVDRKHINSRRRDLDRAICLLAYFAVAGRR